MLFSIEIAAARPDLTDLIEAIMQAHNVRAGAGHHNIHFLQQIDRIICRDDFDGYLRVIRPSLRSIHCSIRSVVWGPTSHTNVWIILLLSYSRNTQRQQLETRLSIPSFLSRLSQEATISEAARQKDLKHAGGERFGSN